MADPLTPEISNRICKHMNQDHADAVLMYAQVYGNSTEATSAEMLAIDPVGMDLMAQVNDTPVPIRVHFDHTLQDSEDAHQTLIAMLRQGRTSK